MPIPTLVNILLCNPYRVAQVSGVNTFASELSTGLRQSGNEARIFAATDNFDPVRPGLRNMRLAWNTLWFIIREREWVDIVHANQPHLQSVAACFASRLGSHGFVVTYHSDLPPSTNWVTKFVNLLSHRFLLKFARVRVFVSNATKESIGRPDDAVIYPGVEVRTTRLEASRTRPSAEPFTFVFVGRKSRTKGFDVLVEATRELSGSSPSKSFQLIVVGESSRQAGDAPRTDFRQQEGRVRNLGLITDRRELLEILRSADVLILPSYFEGLPFVLVEAMAVGCVPIATRVGGIPEIVSDMENGMLIDPGNPQALAHTMRWTMDHAVELCSMSSRAETTILSRFSKERFLNGYLSAYSSVLPS